MPRFDILPMANKIIRSHPTNEPWHGDQAADKGHKGQQAKELKHFDVIHSATGGSTRISASLRLGTWCRPCSSCQ